LPADLMRILAMRVSALHGGVLICGQGEGCRIRA